MSDTALPVIIRFDTAANRAAFTPTPGVAEQLYIWLDSDDQPNAYYWDGAAWQVFNSSGTGDVVGPASAVDDRIATFDGVTGKLIQDGGQTIADVIAAAGGMNQLTGDVTAGPGSGSQAATIPNDTVTYAKIQNISAASRVLGRGSAGGAGDTEELTLGAGLSLTGTVLDAIAGAGGITQLTGDITAGPGSGSQAATIANDAVTTVKILNANVTPAKLSNDAKTYSIGVTVDGAGGVVTTGTKGFRRIPVASTIIRWSLMADIAGDVEFDIFADDPGSTYPPTTSIVASAPPTLSTADFDDDTTLSGWTTSIAAGSVIGFEVTGTPATTTRVTLQLDLRLA